MPGVQCSQCGLFHPALPEGEKCPMAKGPVGPGGQEVNFDPLLRPLKNIVESQITAKQIKDHQKLFGAVIVEITKFLEEYKEE